MATKISALTHIAGQKQDDQLEHIYSSYVRIRDVALMTGQRRWTIGRSGERGSAISVQAARHEDDDDDEGLTISEYCFKLVSVEEMSLKLKLNNSWYRIYFQCGNRFGLWRGVHITYSCFTSRFRWYLDSKENGSTRIERCRAHTNLITVSREKTPIQIPMHSSVNDFSISPSCSDKLKTDTHIAIRMLHFVSYIYWCHMIVYCISLVILLLTYVVPSMSFQTFLYGHLQLS